MTSEPRAQFRQTGGLTALLYATRSGCYRCAVAIVKAGADINQPNPDGITPLLNALDNRDYVQARAINTIDLLLDAGANINACVTNSHTHTAKLVAYIQGRDHEGQTALFAAAEAGWDKVVKHMIDRGADPTVHDASGKLALDYARHPPPPGPGAPAPSAVVIAGREATVAILEALSPKSTVSADTAAAK
jgi:uncharacterized protein